VATGGPTYYDRRNESSAAKDEAPKRSTALRTKPRAPVVPRPGTHEQGGHALDPHSRHVGCVSRTRSTLSEKTPALCRPTFGKCYLHSPFAPLYLSYGSTCRYKVVFVFTHPHHRARSLGCPTPYTVCQPNSLWQHFCCTLTPCTGSDPPFLHPSRPRSS